MLTAVTLHPILLLVLVVLFNAAFLLLLLSLRIRARRAAERRAAFIQIWRPVVMHWSIGNPAVFPITPGKQPMFSHEERFWFLEVWNDMRQSMRGENSAYLNGMLVELKLRNELIQILESRNPGERLMAIQALGQLQDEKAWKALVKLALHAEPLVSFQAVGALLQISSESALPVLIEVLKRHRDWSRARLIGMLRRVVSPRLVTPLGNQMLEALTAQDLALAKDLAVLLAVMRYPATLPYMREVLRRSPSIAMIDIAVKSLGEMRDVKSLPEIQELVEHKDSLLRQQAILALGNMAGPAQIPVLLNVLGDDDWWVVFRAIEAMHKIPGIRPEKLGELYLHPLAQVRDAMNYYQESANLNETVL